MSQGTEETELRDQIAEALSLAFAHASMNTSTGSDLLSFGVLADAAMLKVQPLLDAKDAQIEQLTEERDAARFVSKGRTMEEYDLRDAEAERDRLKAAANKAAFDLGEMSHHTLACGMVLPGNDPNCRACAVIRDLRAALGQGEDQGATEGNEEQ